MRAIRSALTVLFASAAVVTASPSVAGAAPLFVMADVWIDSWSGSYPTVCGRGTVNDGATTVGRWTFTVGGGVPADQWPLGYVQFDDGDTYSYCHTFYAGSPPDAAFTVTLTFTGVGASSDVTGGAALVYEWNSALGDDNQFGVRTNG